MWNFWCHNNGVQRGVPWLQGGVPIGTNFFVIFGHIISLWSSFKIDDLSEFIVIIGGRYFIGGRLYWGFVFIKVIWYWNTLYFNYTNDMIFLIQPDCCIGISIFNSGFFLAHILFYSERDLGNNHLKTTHEHVWWKMLIVLCEHLYLSSSS